MTVSYDTRARRKTQVEAHKKRKTIQQTILETLSPKSRVEELEEEVTILRSAFQALANRLTALEKAQ